MSTTLNDVNSTIEKNPEHSAEETAAKELVRMAKDKGLSLTGPDGLLKQFTKSVLEAALNEEMTEHLGHEKNRVPDGLETANVRNGTRSKTVLTESAGAGRSSDHREHPHEHGPDPVRLPARYSDAGIRDVAIPPHLLPAIKQHLDVHTGPGKDALLFPATAGGHMVSSTLYKV